MRVIFTRRVSSKSGDRTYCCTSVTRGVFVALSRKQNISFLNCYWFPGNCNIFSFVFKLFVLSFHFNLILKVVFYRLFLFANFPANLSLERPTQLPQLTGFLPPFSPCFHTEQTWQNHRLQ